jgi:HD superfamily phosphohydrolase
MATRRDLFAKKVGGERRVEALDERERLNAEPERVSRKAIVHRDQVHGDVHYDPLAVALLDSESMQRLGRIYQLGYAHLVFRGGTHTRLSHVMGASNMATEIVDRLRFNHSQKRATHPKHVVLPQTFLPCPGCSDLDARWEVLRYLVSWAALLHDLGHVPLGHTLEDEFEGIFRKHDDFSSPRSPYLWGADSEVYAILTDKSLYPSSFVKCGIRPEQVWQTVMLICFFKDGPRDGEDDDFVAALDRSQGVFAETLREALQRTGDVFRPYMADIVGNTICADYLDYLRRDPINVGLDVLREIRVLSSFYVCEQPNKAGPSFRMALALVDRQGKPRLDVCTSVVELVRQRYRFAEIIYYHKAKVSASAMFAKAMNLIGTPPEVGFRRRPLYLHDTGLGELAKQLATGAESLELLKETCLPRVLMDPELGDEALHFLLMNRAFDEIATELSKTTSPETDGKSTSDVSDIPDKERRIEECLRGLALLQGISRRRLYKTCLSIGAEQFGCLTQGAEERSEVETRLRVLLKRLREDKALRDRLERKMAAAAGWPVDSLLLYVPPRKSQAKGIETFAFNKAGVVRLGKHPAVAAKVQELGNDYQSLWRLLLLVHPERRREVAALSRAVDVRFTSCGRVLRAACPLTVFTIMSALALSRNRLGSPTFLWSFGRPPTTFASCPRMWRGM